MPWTISKEINLMMTMPNKNRASMGREAFLNIYLGH